MKDDQIKRLQNKIIASRERLLDKAPELALLLMHIRYVAVDKMKGLSTNGRCIYFEAKLIERLAEDEIDFILCHILMHILNRDIEKPRGMVTDSYHFACDISNNDRLCKIYGFSILKCPHLGAVHRVIPWYMTSGSLLSPDSIYRRLPPAYSEDNLKDGSKVLLDNTSWWWMKDNYGVGSGLTLILDVPQKDGFVPIVSGDGNAPGESNGQFWHSLITSINEMDVGGHDNASDDEGKPLERLIGMTESNRINWKSILQSFIQEEITDYSFMPPDRRFSNSNFFLPDFNESTYSVADILFMVDTSGSIKDEMVEVAYGEISNAIEQFNGHLTGYIGFFDDQVYDALPFGNVSELKSIRPKGGGWTDFCPIFKYIKGEFKEKKISSLVIMTDGYGKYPDISEIPDVPVLWIINNDEADPLFGTIVRTVSG